MPYKMYGNRIFQNAKMDLHGPRRDSEPDLLSEPQRTNVDLGETFAYADTDFRGFIATTWPADRPHLPVTRLEISIFILKYTKNPYSEYISK